MLEPTNMRLNSLKSMEQWQQIAIGAAVVAKMYPNYALFCEISKFTGAGKYLNILALVWEYAGGVNNKIDFEKQQLKLDLITPDSKQYDMYGVWPALDAVTALSSLLSVCNKWDADEIDAVLTLSRSTISAYLDLVFEGGEEFNNEDHELYRENESFLKELMNTVELGSKSGGREKVIQKLKSLCAEIQYSNIGLSITQ